MTLYVGFDASAFVDIAIKTEGKKMGIITAEGIPDQLKKVAPVAQSRPFLFDGTPSLWSLKV